MLAGLEVILGIIALFIGIALGYYVRKQKALSEINSAEARAQKIVNEAKAQEKETVIKAQEKALVIIEEAKREETRRYRELNEFQKRLEKRETTFSQKLLELQDKQQKLYDKVNQIEEAKEKIIAIRKEQLAKLEKIAQMTKDEAKEILMNNVEGEIKDALLSRVKKLEQSGIIKKYSALLDYDRLGYDVPVMIEIRVAKGKLFNVENKIATHPNVFAVYDKTGDFDSTIIARFKNRKSMDAFLKKIQTYDFIERTETQLILNTIKEEGTKL